LSAPSSFINLEATPANPLEYSGLETALIRQASSGHKKQSAINSAQAEETK